MIGSLGWIVWVLLLMPRNGKAARPRAGILKRLNPTFSLLNDDGVSKLVNLTNLDSTLDWNDPDSWLARLLVPRLPGSANLKRIQSSLVDEFEKLGWHVEQDEFDQDTPMGKKHFNNLVFTHDPDAPRRLVLSAHIDSKYFAQGDFIGATDSAAPCAMLIDLALALTPWLDERKKRVQAQGGEQGTTGQGETLQLIFFDGEEAFVEWTHEDSIYGSKHVPLCCLLNEIINLNHRHLAEKWSQVSQGPGPANLIPRTTIERISHLVLFDLLGSARPVIRSFYPQTGWLFDEFLHAETTLGRAGHLWHDVSGDNYDVVKANPSAPQASFFVSRSAGVGFAGGVEDDHIPFLHRRVPIVHMIPLPFPPVWHTLRDDASALDLPTVKAWTLIIRLTVAQYFGLGPNVSTAKRKAAEPIAAHRNKRAKGELVSLSSYEVHAELTLCLRTDDK